VALQIATAGRVERNEKMRRYKALATLFAPSWGIREISSLTDRDVVKLVDERIDSAHVLVDSESKPPVELQLYRAYATNKREKLVGVAFPVGGNGFWAPIKGFLAVDPEKKFALGIEFVDQKETPGLGARITEKAFTDQFGALARESSGKEPLMVSPPQKKNATFIYIGKGEPTGPNDPRYRRSVDAITGATQTSLAVERFLNENLKRVQRAFESGEIVKKGDNKD